MSTYLLGKRENGYLIRIYLMKGGTREYLDSFNTIKNFEDFVWVNRKMTMWLARQDSPKSIIFYDSETQSDPLKNVATPQPTPTPTHDHQHHVGTGEKFAKPTVIRKPTPNQSSRNGAKIRRIVLHYTTAGNDQSTISWFANPQARVSAHYLVGKTGTIYQFVNDSNKAWHAANNNDDTIGIEHTARAGEKLTAAQEKATIELLRFLLAEYKLSKSSITGHRFIRGQATACPGTLWPTEQDLRTWVNKNFPSPQ